MTIRVKSYWDWLPPEIQEYIVLLAQHQHVIDRVDEVWGLGRVKIVHCNKKCWFGCKCWFCHFHNPFHTMILLTYIDEYHLKKTWYLREVNLNNLDVLLKRVIEDKNYLRGTDQLELDMSY